MYHYTYEIVYQSGMRYIGSRTSKKKPEDDSTYWGSSKHTPKNDKTKEKIILSIFPTREEAYEHEIYLHKYNEVESNHRYYNKASQTSTGFTHYRTKLSPEHKEKLRQAQIGRIKSPEEIERIREMNLGKKATEASNQAQKATFVAKGILYIGEDGKYHITDSQKAKLSEALSGRVFSNEHKSKIGKSNSGKKRTKEFCDAVSKRRQGVSTGTRSQETKDKQSIALKGINTKYPDKYRWINFRTKETRYATCTEMSDKFCKGFSSNFTAIIRKRYKSYHKWGLDDEQ